MNSFDFFSVGAFCLIVGIPLFLLIVCFVKKVLDEKEGSTGIIGWIIAILIACAIIYALCTSDEGIIHYRHT